MRARRARRADTAFRHAAGIAVLLAAGVAAQGGALAQSSDEPRITKAFQVTGDDLAPTRTYSAPYMAVDPENPLNIVASTPEFRSKSCRLMRSTNGGKNWKILENTPSPGSYPFCFHTSGTAFQTAVAFGRNGTLYYALNGYDNQDLGTANEHGGVYGNISVLLARSNDMGDTWEEPTVVRSTRGKFGAEGENNRPVNSIAVDTERGDQDIVYVSWRRNAAPGVTPAPVGQAMIATSTDGGRTFGEPVVIVGDYFKQTNKPEPEKWGAGTPQVAVGTDGSVYAAFFGSTTVTGTPANAILVGRSTDQGKTFTITEAAPPSPQYLPLIMTYSPEGSDLGTVHLIYEDKIGPEAGLSDRDIYTKRSTDGGKTWTEAKLINDDKAQAGGGGHLQVNPNLGVAPNGRLDAVWWDFRDDVGGFTNDVYYAYSTDNGETWSKNYRITDRSIDRRRGVWSNGFDMRTPVGIASTDDLAVIAWDDTRNTIEQGDGQDLYASVVQHSAIGGGGNDAARYVLAALLGLAAVGLILLAVSFAAGRKTRAAEPVTARTPADVKTSGKVGS
jgi:hypothetical protein